MKKYFITTISIFVCLHLFSQNVGIGTSTPFSKLTVQTDLHNYGITHTDNNIKLSTFIGGGAGGGWIGTQSNHPFHIYTNNGQPQVSFHTNFRTDFKGTAPTLRLLDGSTASATLMAIGNNFEIAAGTGNFTQGDLILQADPITPPALAGKIGVGTRTPADKFTVYTPTGLYGISHTDDVITLATWLGNDGGYFGTKSFHPLRFFTASGPTQMTLLTNGNVGIGTAIPATKLEVIGSVRINADMEAIRVKGDQPYISFYNSSNNYRGYMWNRGADDIEVGTSIGNTVGKLHLSIKGTPRLSIATTGQVAVNGVPAPYLSPAFTVNGILAMARTSEWTLDPTTGGSVGGGSGPHLVFYGNGFLRARIDALGDWIALSDRSLKEGIQEYKPVLEGIKKLKVSTYNYTYANSSTKGFGLIAQNVAEYFPEVVSSFEGKSGEALLGISYAKTGVLAIKAIQEQQEKIDAQEKKIDDINKEIATLKDQNERLLSAINKLTQSK